MQTISVPYRTDDGCRALIRDCRRVQSAAVRTAYANGAAADGTLLTEQDRQSGQAAPRRTDAKPQTPSVPAEERSRREIPPLWFVCNPNSETTNLRWGPSAQKYAVRKILNNGHLVYVLGTARSPVNGALWYRVIALGVEEVEGYVSAETIGPSCAV